MSTATASGPPAGTAGRPGPSDARSGALSHKQILTIMSGLMLGMFLAALDQTIVSVAIRTIADDLNGLSLQAWATTAYLITATISTPLYGKLSDQFGRKPFFLTAISIFLVGSMLCTLSTSMYELAAFRALQGLGAGGLFSLALAIIGDIVPPRERAKYQGYFLAVFGTSSVLGPVVGGFLSGQRSILGIDGWRWVFLVNVPIGALALIVVARVLNIPHTKRPHRIDWPGAIAIAIALVPLLIVAEQGREWGWGSGRALACYLVGAVGLGLFLLAERRIGEDALIPLRLFRGSVFSVTSVAGVVVGMGMFGGIAVLPQYLQIVKGASPTKAGLLIVPLVLGIMAASIVSGQLTARTGRYKIFPVVGTLLMTGALLLLSLRLHADTPLWEADLYMAMFGLGLGGCMQTLMLAVQNAVPARDMGVASSSSTFFRQMGGTLGTAVFLSILFSTVTSKIADAFRTIAPTPEFQAALADLAVRANPVNAQVLQAVQTNSVGGNGTGVLQDSSFLQRIDPRLAKPFLVGFSDSMDLVFLVGAIVMVFAVVLILFLKELPLRTQSGLEARAAELAAEGAALPAPAPVAAEAVEADRTGPAQVERAVPPHVAKSVGNGHAEPRVPALVGVGVRVGAGAGTGPDATGNGARLATPDHAPGAGLDGALGGTPVGDGPRASQHGAASPDDVDGQIAPAAGAGAEHVGPVIFGQVTRRGAAALPGATLTLTDLTGHQLDREVSNASGHYRLVPPTGGTYLVICASSTHGPQAALVAVADRPARHDVDLPGDGASMSGTVRGSGQATGLPGAVVTLIDALGDVAAAATTDAGGDYTFADLTEGGYTLTVAAHTIAPVAESVTVSTGSHLVHDVVVAVRARLVGSVRSASAGTPVAEALATLVDTDGNVVGSVITGSDGGFTFEDLSIGSYTVIATGYPPMAAEVQVAAGQPTETVLTLQPPTVAGAGGDGRDPADRGPA